ncbi:hypothetical protein BGZ49_000188 [Haplosporangium sp. Z 27]|nr:hypothetical protein BGZ49_000188 [Haplosporangium sp. Z 27]
MSTNTSENTTPLQVLIIGAGLGGLMLGAILETAKINYHILERAAEVKPLGSAIALTGNVLPIFEQLGIFEDLKKVALPHIEMDFYDLKRKKTGNIHLKAHKKVCGYDFYVLSRSKLYDLIRGQVPKHRISMGKKVLNTKEENDKVTVFCSDDTTYECRIIVGADGAYSTVRQSMYQQLEEDRKLPLSDKDGFSIGYVNLVGVARPSNPEKYPELSDDERAHFRLLIGNKSDSSCTVTVPDNQICWGIQIQLPSSKSQEQHFKNSEWGPESADAMMKEYEDFPSPIGGTMKDMFDATPKDLISKVFLEEKIFQTWHHGRSVLIGDACHKLLPGGGQGAVMAMKDAVVLANCIFNMKDNSSKSVKSAFESYYRQRFPEADIQFKNSALMSKIMSGQKWFERVLRYLMTNYMPYRLLDGKHENEMAFRPQINWLPLAESTGIGKVLPQVGREEAALLVTERNRCN